MAIIGGWCLCPYTRRIGALCLVSRCRQIRLMEVHAGKRADGREAAQWRSTSLYTTVQYDEAVEFSRGMRDSVF